MSKSNWISLGHNSIHGTVIYVPADSITSIYYCERTLRTRVNIFGQGVIEVYETREEVQRKIDETKEKDE